MMTNNSLKKLLSLFPYFFDKREVSNFFKSQYVTNERFKDSYQSLFQTYESFHLNKRCLIWKEQDTGFEYIIHFVANFSDLKSVNVFKDGEIIYCRNYNLEDHVSSFSFDYSYDARNEFSFDNPFSDEEVPSEISVDEKLLLDKLLVWRADIDEDSYDVHFKASFNNLKSVTLYKNNNVIYTKSFENSDDETIFDYSYRNSIVNNDENIESGETFVFSDIFHVEVETYTNPKNIIKYCPLSEPLLITESLFHIEIETYDEYFISKGFPENDMILNDIYDHDISLDEIGESCNVPRKNYIITADYDNTEPKYNNRLTEDDYHYMKRIIKFLIRLNNCPAPILELWKLYGITASMVNRERLLVKMFDIYKHPYSIDGDKVIVDSWQPKKWEHKDKFCDEGSLFGEFFFVSVNTVQPVKKQNILFNFSFLNGFAEELIDDDYVVDIYLDGELVTDVNGDLLNDFNRLQWRCDASLLDEYSENIFTFIGRRQEKIIDEVEIIIIVRGCNDADIYVKADSTESHEDGSKDYPYKTLEKGMAAVTGVKNLVAVFGEIETNGNIPVKENCTVIGCNNARVINFNNAVFFNVKQDVDLTVQDVTFTTDHFEGYVETMIWSNENKRNLIENALAYNLNYGVLIEDLFPNNFIKNLDFNLDTGALTWEEYSKSELTKLNDFKGIVTNLELSDEFRYNESEIYEWEGKLLEMPFIYFKDRKDLANAISNLQFDRSKGELIFDVYPEEEIVYSAKLHDIL